MRYASQITFTVMPPSGVRFRPVMNPAGAAASGYRFLSAATACSMRSTAMISRPAIFAFG